MNLNEKEEPLVSFLYTIVTFICLFTILLHEKVSICQLRDEIETLKY